MIRRSALYKPKTFTSVTTPIVCNRRTRRKSAGARDIVPVVPTSFFELTRITLVYYDQYGSYVNPTNIGTPPTSYAYATINPIVPRWLLEDSDSILAFINEEGLDIDTSSASITFLDDDSKWVIDGSFPYAVSSILGYVRINQVNSQSGWKVAYSLHTGGYLLIETLTSNGTTFTCRADHVETAPLAREAFTDIPAAVVPACFKEAGTNSVR